jgi:hypothetical protein
MSDKTLGYKLLDKSGVNIESNPSIFECFQGKLAGVVMTFHGMNDEGISKGEFIETKTSSRTSTAMIRSAQGIENCGHYLI